MRSCSDASCSWLAAVGGQPAELAFDRFAPAARSSCSRRSRAGFAWRLWRDRLALVGDSAGPVPSSAHPLSGLLGILGHLPGSCLHRPVRFGRRRPDVDGPAVARRGRVFVDCGSSKLTRAADLAGRSGPGRDRALRQSAGLDRVVERVADSDMAGLGGQRAAKSCAGRARSGVPGHGGGHDRARPARARSRHYSSPPTTAALPTQHPAPPGSVANVVVVWGRLLAAQSGMAMAGESSDQLIFTSDAGSSWSTSSTADLPAAGSYFFGTPVHRRLRYRGADDRTERWNPNGRSGRPFGSGQS